MSDNKNLQRAREKPNDEFYTFYKDIETEINNYREYFVGKIVYCNCDNDKSNFWKYFYDNFHDLQLKKLIASHYNKDGHSFVLTYDGEKINKIELTSNGDFHNKECDKFYEESDIIVTNPPFSLFRDYFMKLIQFHKHFLIIGNRNCAVYKNTFPLFMNREVCFGYSQVKEFLTPDGSIKKFGNTCWVTNLPVYKNKRLVLTQRYYDENGNAKSDKYPTYDNYNAINVDRLENIPIDYDGVMGVPITFFDYCDSNGGGLKSSVLTDIRSHQTNSLEEEVRLQENQNMHECLLGNAYKVVGVSEDSGAGYSFGLRHKNSKFTQPFVYGRKKYIRCFIQKI